MAMFTLSLYQPNGHQQTTMSICHDIEMQLSQQQRGKHTFPEYLTTFFFLIGIRELVGLNTIHVFYCIMKHVNKN